jgi:uncharacterized protein YgbK (DUF1537 family)
MAARVYRLGDRAGNGSKVKIINQLLAGVHIAAAAEAMALGLREGVDPAQLYDVITHSAGNSWMFENRMAHVLAGDYTPLSAVDIFVKDLGLVLDTARATKFPLPLASTAHQMFMQASSAGFAREDDAAVIKIFPASRCPRSDDVRLGCIADDFTGATDLANNLVRAGMRAVQTIGVPRDGAAIDADAVVVALKSRTIEPARAVEQSLAACRWLRANGASQIYFKVCSTFDSTPRGNIGPVLEALMDELGCDFTIATPAFPDNARTVFKGHLFVGDVLLSESGMRHHPLTPMTDANLVRVLQAQLATTRPGGRAPRRVGLVEHRATGDSSAAIETRFAELRASGVSIAIADAIDNDDLVRLGEAARSLAVVCAGSGLAIGLPRNFGIAPSRDAASLPSVRGRSAIVSGSCSEATNAQVAAFIADGGAARRIDPLALAGGEDAGVVAEVAQWAEGRWAEAPDAPVLVYSTAAPSDVAAAQRQGGAHDVGARLEAVLAAVAAALVEGGVRRLVVAGGETSGACVQALGVEQLRIGAQIDPGVPWCHATPPGAREGLLLALKSGQLRRGRLLHPRLRQGAVTWTKRNCARSSAASAGRFLRAATSTARPAT